MDKVGFVILHYLAFSMTKCCCDVLLNMFDDICVVIVDNGSNNGSGKNLKEYYLNNDHVKVIENTENVGFAKGNNIGYAFLKQVGCNYIIVMNNDVIISDSHFIINVKKLYKKSKPGLIGPNIISLAINNSQSPIRLKPLTDQELLKIKGGYQKKEWFSFLYFLKASLSTVVTHDHNKQLNRSIQHMNVVLHGACLVFTPLYVGKYDFAFLDKTFLYFEEDILYEFCRHEGLDILYSPLLEVYHLEDISTNQKSLTAYKKMKFKNKCEKESLNVLINMRNMDNG